MKQEQESMKLVPKVTLKEMLFNSALRQPLIIAIMMMLAQQLSGINAAIFFSTEIFRSAGLTDEASQSATLGMGAMNVAMTFVSLVAIEKAGRKTLMVAGLIGMFCMTTLLLISLLLKVSANLSLIFTRLLEPRNARREGVGAKIIILINTKHLLILRSVYLPLINKQDRCYQETLSLCVSSHSFEGVIIFASFFLTQFRGPDPSRSRNMIPEYHRIEIREGSKPIGKSKRGSKVA